MEVITLHTETEIASLIQKYAAEEGISSEDFVLRAVLEKLEDLEDLAIGQTAYHSWLKGGKVTYTLAEVWKNLAEWSHHMSPK